MATTKDTKRISGGVVYRGKKFPGFNKPKRNSGSSKHKMEVLAKKGNEIKVVKFGHKDYGHNQVGLRRMISSLRTIGLEKFSGQVPGERKKALPKNHR